MLLTRRFLLALAAILTLAPAHGFQGEHPIDAAEAWWAAVQGSVYRGTLEQMSVEERERVQIANFNYIRTSRIRSVEANVVYALATKP